MKPEEKRTRVTELSSALFDGQITVEQRQELNRLLNGDPEACEWYLDLAEIDAHLLFEGGIAPEMVEPPKPKVPSARNRGWAIVAAALIALLATNAWLLVENPMEEPESDADGVAVLSRLVGVESDYREGDVIPRGDFELDSGFAQLEFFSGATVIIEAPASLDLLSPERVVCHLGKLHTYVPEPAQGFTIEAPDYHAVDLGTEFSLTVGADKRSELHVVNGEVRLDDENGKTLRHLTTGLGIQTGSSSSEINNIENPVATFIDRKSLMTLAQSGSEERYRQWREERSEFPKRANAVIDFDFENQDQWDRQLIGSSPQSPNGAIVGAQWTGGRWPGKGALEFKRTTDRVRLRVPGKYESLTLASWVRIEGFDSWYSSLLLTDGWDIGEVHWQITNKGTLILGVSTVGNGESPTVLRPSDLGRWIHLAVVVDGVTDAVTHFVDGKAVSRTKHKKDLPALRIGNAEIGNWRSDANSGHPLRSLNGRIDEFTVFPEALDAEEIALLFEQGQINQ